MTFGDKLSKLRKENNITQEQLAATLGVSRQAVSRWESGSSYPETDKLIRMCDLFDCSLDFLVRDVDTPVIHEKRPLIPERRSKKEIFGMPLWHTGKCARGFIAMGFDARGVIAVGFRAQGIISVGLLSFGVISLGLLSFALLSLGVICIGLAAYGSFAFGLLAGGALCCGVFSTGAIAIGDFSVGALSIGKYAAIGDNARAAIAIGTTEANGTLFSHVGSNLSPADISRIELLLRDVPSYLRWAAKLFMKCI